MTIKCTNVFTCSSGTIIVLITFSIYLFPSFFFLFTLSFLISFYTLTPIQHFSLYVFFELLYSRCLLSSIVSLPIPPPPSRSKGGGGQFSNFSKREAMALSEICILLLQRRTRRGGVEGLQPPPPKKELQIHRKVVIYST